MDSSHVGWEVQTESTKTETGKLVKKCTVCGHEGTETKDIPVGFVYVKGGTVEGATLPWNPTSDSEKGVFVEGRTVTLSDFFMGRHEVTQTEYKEYCNYTSGKNPTKEKGLEDDYPAYNVSWYNAVVYCNKRSLAENLTPCYSKGSETNPDKWGTVRQKPTK